MAEPVINPSAFIYHEGNIDVYGQLFDVRGNEMGTIDPVNINTAENSIDRVDVRAIFYQSI